ncbi:uncharacterized protein A4U43_C09F15890 [Asparagus officinalis]|uniref:Uncharacterized protein n=1 Tax=Asparagus officinalis TaxID=4686 RepID=A0A5P1E7Q0_ASPOF|nr:uncharacterized protein A4U43_C09F15890 [Asparagus officinalis]
MMPYKESSGLGRLARDLPLNVVFIVVFESEGRRRSNRGASTTSASGAPEESEVGFLIRVFSRVRAKEAGIFIRGRKGVERRVIAMRPMRKNTRTRLETRLGISFELEDDIEDEIGDETSSSTTRLATSSTTKSELRSEKMRSENGEEIGDELSDEIDN